VDFGPTEEARQRSILNKLKLHVGLLKAGGGYNLTLTLQSFKAMNIRYDLISNPLV
jgi:hypothetical protein